MRKCKCTIGKKNIFLLEERSLWSAVRGGQFVILGKYEINFVNNNSYHLNHLLVKFIAVQNI